MNKWIQSLFQTLRQLLIVSAVIGLGVSLVYGLDRLFNWSSLAGIIGFSLMVFVFLLLRNRASLEKNES